MVFGGEQGADVAPKHKVRLACALDGLYYLRVGSVYQRTHLAADLLLPGRKGVDVGVDPRISSRFGRFRLRCHCRYLSLLCEDAFSWAVNDLPMLAAISRPQKHGSIHPVSHRCILELQLP